MSLFWNQTPIRLNLLSFLSPPVINFWKWVHHVQYQPPMGTTCEDDAPQRNHWRALNEKMFSDITHDACSIHLKGASFLSLVCIIIAPDVDPTVLFWSDAVITTGVRSIFFCSWFPLPSSQTHANEWGWRLEKHPSVIICLCHPFNWRTTSPECFPAQCNKDWMIKKKRWKHTTASRSERLGKCLLLWKPSCKNAPKHLSGIIKLWQTQNNKILLNQYQQNSKFKLR